MAKITELNSFVMEELCTVNKHFTDLSSRIDSGKCHKEMSQRNSHFKGKLCLKKLYYQNFS